ncbi:uncharacterized protein RB166_006978 [Leptodactylus fuscus]
MNSDRCFTLPGDINANISPKDFAETSHDCSVEPNLKTKKRKKKTFLKRKWYFGKYGSPDVKKSIRSSSPVFTQENRHIDLKNTDKENEEDPEIRHAEDHSLPSGELKVCDIKTKQAIKQTCDGIQTASEMKPEDYVTRDTKPSINTVSPLQAQSLHTIVIEEEHHNKTDLKMKMDKNCQPNEVAEKYETEREVIQDLSLEIDTKASRNKKLDKQTNKRLRPNYFVAIPITNDEILDLIEDVQEHVVLKEPKLFRALIQAEKVHITILVAHLQTEEDIKRAISALLQSKEKVEKLLHGKPLGLPLHGIGEFNNQVIYIKVAEQVQELLSKIAEVVTQCFVDVGVNISGSKDFKPHLTFLKLSKVPSLRRKGFRRICKDLYKEYEDVSFGTEMFSRIDLCAMHKKSKESGYYYCESSILIDGIISNEGEDTGTEIVNDPVPGRETTADSSITFSLVKDADKIRLDIADALTISKKEGIKETDGQPEATNTNLGEKSCSQSTPDLFPAEPIASTAVDDGPEKQN